MNERYIAESATTRVELARSQAELIASHAELTRSLADLTRSHAELTASQVQLTRSLSNRNDDPAPLSTAQLQQLLVLWLLLTADPDQIDLSKIDWDHDIAPHLDALPNAQQSFERFASFPGTRGQVANFLQVFVSTQPTPWGGGGDCNFTRDAILGMFPR